MIISLSIWAWCTIGMFTWTYIIYEAEHDELDLEDCCMFIVLLTFGPLAALGAFILLNNFNVKVKL